MPDLTANLELLTPEFALAGLAFLVFTADLLLPSRGKVVLPWLAAGGLSGIIVLSLLMLWGQNETLYDGLLAVDDYSLFFKVFFLGIGIFIVFASIDYVDQFLENPGEFYGLLLLSILGMNVMAQSRELLTAYISLELLSFSLYVLASHARSSPRSNEAGLKYILIGAFSSAILLYGISMVYGTLGVTRFDDISAALAVVDGVSPSLWVGVALILVGLGFKVAAVPFHMWAPDVYEGSPFPITAYLAIGSKTAAFALALRLAAEGFVPAVDRWEQWQVILAILAAATMLTGNLVALAQRNLKRLMAYSGISHGGFVLAGLAALSSSSALASNGIMLYLVGYCVASLVVFAGLIAFFNTTKRETITGLAGLADSRPFLAAAIAIGLFSLGGLPVFAGFAIKFYLFTAIAQAGFLWLAGLAIFSSLVSIYYYLQVIRQMYIEPASDEPDETFGEQLEGEAPTARLAASPSVLLLGVMAVGVAALFWIGVYPAPLLDPIEAASQAILP